MVLLGLWYRFTPYELKTLNSCSDRPCMYGSPTIVRLVGLLSWFVLVVVVVHFLDGTLRAHSSYPFALSALCTWRNSACWSSCVVTYCNDRLVSVRTTDLLWISG